LHVLFILGARLPYLLILLLGIQIIDSAMRGGRMIKCRSGGVSRYLDRLPGNVGEEHGHSLRGNSPLREVQQRGKPGFSV